MPRVVLDLGIPQSRPKPPSCALQCIAKIPAAWEDGAGLVTRSIERGKGGQCDGVQRDIPDASILGFRQRQDLVLKVNLRPEQAPARANST